MLAGFTYGWTWDPRFWRVARENPSGPKIVQWTLQVGPLLVSRWQYPQ